VSFAPSPIYQVKQKMLHRPVEPAWIIGRGNFAASIAYHIVENTPLGVLISRCLSADFDFTHGKRLAPLGRELLARALP
jgi:hypothetical protein